MYNKTAITMDIQSLSKGQQYTFNFQGVSGIFTILRFTAKRIVIKFDGSDREEAVALSFFDSRVSLIA